MKKSPKTLTIWHEKGGLYIRKQRTLIGFCDPATESPLPLTPKAK
jgi:hypothetical protein